MKIFKPIFYGLFFTLLFSNLSYGQTQRTATLRCDIPKLKSGTPAYQACAFAGQQEGSDTREFTIDAQVGDQIQWNGASSDGNGSIDIKKIKYDKGTNVFNKKDIEGASTVVGVVKNKTNGQPYKYTISFKVNNTGKMYSIDPKIRVSGGD